MMSRLTRATTFLLPPQPPAGTIAMASAAARKTRFKIGLSLEGYLQYYRHELFGFRGEADYADFLRSPSINSTSPSGKPLRRAIAVAARPLSDRAYISSKRG